MFETDLILWLQSLSSEWLTTAMVVISKLGDPRLYTVLALIVTFGFDFRLGVALFQMMLWSIPLNGLLKTAFALPRPVHVDSAVQFLGHDTTNTTPFRGQGGRHFLALPDATVIEHYRAQSNVSFGLPSGHVSLATAFMGGMGALFHSRPVAIGGAVFVVATAVSRMYLGQHFLADVLGGFLLGLLVVLSIRSLLPPARLRQLLVARDAIKPSRQRVGLAALVIVVPLALLLFGPAVRLRSVGRLVGANLALAFLMVRGLPLERTAWMARLGRVGLALFLYVAAGRAATWSMAYLGLRGTPWAEFIRGMLPLLVVLLGTVEAGAVLRLYGTLPAAPVRRASLAS